MPVDPAAGQSSYGGSDPSVVTFVDPSNTASVLIAASTLVGAASITIPASSVTQPAEGVIDDQNAAQTSLDDNIPCNLLGAFVGLLLLCMLVTHTRFLGRVFASMSRRKAPRQVSKNPYAFDMSTHLGGVRTDKSKRPVGGGQLGSGWFLRRGQEVDVPGDMASWKIDPFASPFDEVDPRKSTPSPPTTSPPPRIVPLLDHLPFSSAFLFAPFSRLPYGFTSSVSLTQLYLITGYLILVAFALIWRSDITPTTSDKGYGDDFSRTGLVTVAQIPVVVALGVRGNIIGLCVGKGYERLKIFHKVVGRVLFLCSTVHAAFSMHKWTLSGQFWESTRESSNVFGLLAWASIVLIAFTSMPHIRKLCYGMFEVCHFVGMVLLLVGVALHKTVAKPFCIAAGVIYGFSILASLTKTRLAHAELSTLPGSTTTVITIPLLRTGWRAGQHVRIRIPALGFSNALQGHPFTIASAPDGEGMVLMCKATGDWTKRLYEFASHGALCINNGEWDRERKTAATVILEGPYGGLGNTLLPAYSSVMLVAGGSGITHALTLANDLLTRAPTGVVRARTIDLVWMVSTEDIARPFMPTLLEMVEGAHAFEEKCLEGRKLRLDLPPPVALRMRIHVTRCPLSSPLTLLQPPLPISNPFASEHDDVFEDRRGLRRQPSEAEREKVAYLSRSSSTVTYTSIPPSTSKYYSPLSSLGVMRRRPIFEILLNGLIEETIERSKRENRDSSGICVTACGPEQLVNDVRGEIRRLDGGQRRKVGGVDLEEERFGF